MKRFAVLACSALTALGLAGRAAAAVLISDNFETDTSANYTIVDNNSPSDGTTTFAYDYINAGIPLAPHSAAGDKGGFRITANDTAPAAAEAITAFNNTAVNASEYELSVDVYMYVHASSGTTEHAHVGVAGDGATVNSLFTPITGSGHFIAFDGEGGSSSDYRHSTPSGLTNTGDMTYLDPAHTTDAGGALYQSIFPAPTYQFPGSPGNAWTTLTIRVSGGNIVYSFDGAPIIQAAYDGSDGNKVSLGYGDLFSTVASPLQSVYVVYDNLQVRSIPEPASLGLLGCAAIGLVAAARRRG